MSEHVVSEHHRRHAPPLYGVMAEFENPTELVAAARKVYSLGYRRINGYSPYPIEELSEAIGFTHTSLPLIVFIGGLLGGLAGFFMQYWIEVIDYPLNVGGRPQHSPSPFIPITFELGVLFTAITIFFGLLFRMGLPRPPHPVFEAEGFRRASIDELWLSVAAPSARADEAQRALRELGAAKISRVEDLP